MALNNASLREYYAIVKVIWKVANPEVHKWITKKIQQIHLPWYHQDHVTNRPTRCDAPPSEMMIAHNHGRWNNREHQTKSKSPSPQGGWMITTQVHMRNQSIGLHAVNPITSDSTVSATKDTPTRLNLRLSKARGQCHEHEWPQKWRCRPNMQGETQGSVHPPWTRPKSGNLSCSKKKLHNSEKCTRHCTWDYKAYKDL